MTPWMNPDAHIPAVGRILTATAYGLLLQEAVVSGPEEAVSEEAGRQVGRGEEREFRNTRHLCRTCRLAVDRDDV